MRPVDLALVMGIFLDNAIEAAENTDEKLIRFAVITAPEYLRFLLQNSSLPPECPISRLTEWGVSTKENTGESDFTTPAPFWMHIPRFSGTFIMKIRALRRR